MLHNHRSVYWEDSQSIMVLGGGGNCFSFGTHLNDGPVFLNLPLSWKTTFTSLPWAACCKLKSKIVTIMSTTSTSFQEKARKTVNRKTDTVHGIYQPLFLQSLMCPPSSPPSRSRRARRWENLGTSLISPKGNETGLNREAQSHQRWTFYEDNEWTHPSGQRCVIDITEPWCDSVNSEFNFIFCCYCHGLHNLLSSWSFAIFFFLEPTTLPANNYPFYPKYVCSCVCVTTLVSCV